MPSFVSIASAENFVGFRDTLSRRVHDFRPAEVKFGVCHQKAKAAQRAGAWRNENAADAELLRDLASVKRTCAAEGHEAELAHVIALFHGNNADGSADIVRASADENGVASFGCKSDNDYAGLVLNRKDKTFNFMQSYRFSAALSGTYEENDDYLILTAKNSGSQSKFTFKKEKSGLEFLAKKSDPVREFCYSADSEKTDKCLKNKAFFAPESIRTDVITYIGKNEHDGQKD